MYVIPNPFPTLWNHHNILCSKYGRKGCLLCNITAFRRLYGPTPTHLRLSSPLPQDINNNLEQHIESCHCDNFNYLIGALYVYKGLLVVFGLFLAYESRNVKYFYINDSRFVTIAMYIVVILVGIGATISLVLAQNLFGDPAYGLAVAMVVAACMSCLLILYVPKVSWVWGPVQCSANSVHCMCSGVV